MTTGNRAEGTAARAVLWDVDGTLLDTAELHYLAWRDILAQEHFELTPALFRAYFGRRNDAVLHGYFGADFPAVEIERISTAKESRFRELLLATGIEPLPGVRHWLQRLQAAGWCQAVASSAPRLNLEAMLQGLGVNSFFEVTMAGEDVQRGKPDPQIFLAAAAALDVPPSRCVVIEDAPAGLTGARRAGMRTIGVRSTHPEIEADRVVTTLDQLPEDTFEQLIPRSDAA